METVKKPANKDLIVSILYKKYKEEKEQSDYDKYCKHSFLASNIFKFDTYDYEIDIYLSKKMLEVIGAILEKENYNYLKKDRENYINYMLMCNSIFLKKHLDWGTSIRSCFFTDQKIDIEFEGKYYQIEFEKYVESILEFINTD